MARFILRCKASSLRGIQRIQGEKMVHENLRSASVVAEFSRRRAAAALTSLGCGPSWPISSLALPFTIGKKGSFHICPQPACPNVSRPATPHSQTGPAPSRTKSSHAHVACQALPKVWAAWSLAACALERPLPCRLQGLSLNLSLSVPVRVPNLRQVAHMRLSEMKQSYWKNHASGLCSSAWSGRTTAATSIARAANINLSKQLW